MASKSEGVYQRLKGEIEELSLPPGTRLSELVVAERIGASRTPIREAIRRLAREGLVHHAPGEVARVAPISLRGVRTLFEFRMILEPAAARMVAADGATDPGRTEAFEALVPEFERVRDGLGSRSREELAANFRALAERFDQALVAATHNGPLARAITDTRGQTKRLRRIAQTDPSRLGASLQEHLRMCRALIDGPPDAAASEVAHHLAQTLNTVIDELARGSTGTDVHL